MQLSSSLRRIGGALVVALLVASLAATTVAAGKPDGSGGTRGGGGGGGGKHTTSATLTVTPNPVAAGGAIYTVSGTGYPASSLVGVSVADPGCCMAFNVATDASGNVSFQAQTAGPGTYTITVYRYGSTTVLGRVTFVVA